MVAQAAGRRPEIARSRYIAASTLRGTLRVYQQELDYQYRQRPGGGYPPEFAALAGQERLAGEILRTLPDLSRRTARRVRAELPPLFGSITLDFVESHMYVPETSRDPQGEQSPHELALHRVTAEPDRYSDGLLPRLLSDQNLPARPRGRAGAGGLAVSGIRYDLLMTRHNPDGGTGVSVDHEERPCHPRPARPRRHPARPGLAPRRR